MSAQDRLAAIIAEHDDLVVRRGEDYCRCGEPVARRAGFHAHVAAVIASADDLAVIETRPVKVYREGGEWMCETGEEVGSVLPVGVKDWEIDEIEGQLAEAIAQVRAVRAARAAEAVSDQ